MIAVYNAASHFFARRLGMPKVVIHRNGEQFAGEVPENSNLVVRAGVRQFPFPHLAYGCGMGKCGKCASRVLAGADQLPEPNWKETAVLGDRLQTGHRLACQLWIQQDIELHQEGVPTGAARAGR